MSVYRRLYHRLFQRVSSPVHPAVSVGCSVSCFPSPACGVQGAFVAPLLQPLPHRLPVAAARYLAGHGRSRRSLSRWGKGCAPAPLRAGERFRAVIDPSSSVVPCRPARRFGGGKLAPSGLLAVLFAVSVRPSRRSSATQGGADGGVPGASLRRRSISFPHRIMTNRFTQALRLLLGKPLVGMAIDGTMLLDQPEASEFDYTRQPPFELAFHYSVPLAPPSRVFAEDRLRVCVFTERNGDPCPGCGRDLRWLVLELRGADTWLHLVTLHESKLPILLSVLTDVAKYLDEE